MGDTQNEVRDPSAQSVQTPLLIYMVTSGLLLLILCLLFSGSLLVVLFWTNNPRSQESDTTQPSPRLGPMKAKTGDGVEAGGQETNIDQSIEKNAECGVQRAPVFLA